MKGEIDHITSKIETLEMNQETAHTVSTRSLFLFFLFSCSWDYTVIQLIEQSILSGLEEQIIE